VCVLWSSCKLYVTSKLEPYLGDECLLGVHSACEMTVMFILSILINVVQGARSGVVVKALYYKPAGRGFDSQWCRWNFSVT